MPIDWPLLSVPLVAALLYAMCRYALDEARALRNWAERHDLTLPGLYVAGASTIEKARAAL